LGFLHFIAPEKALTGSGQLSNMLSKYMIMIIKQNKIKIEPRIKLNYNIFINPFCHDESQNKPKDYNNAIMRGGSNFLKF